MSSSNGVAISRLPQIDVEPEQVETDIVVFRLTAGHDHQTFVDHLLAETDARDAARNISAGLTRRPPDPDRCPLPCR